MSPTFKGVLHGDRIEWTGPAPPVPPDGSVRVQVTVIPARVEMTDEERGRRMFEAMERLAARPDSSFPKDVMAWQREVRQDRPLPGRED